MQDKRKSSIKALSSGNVLENVTIPPDLMSDIPIRVVELVQEMLNDTAGVTKSEHFEKTKQSQNVVLNIWDFAGQAVYYTTHQVSIRPVTGLLHKVNIIQLHHPPSEY